MPDSSAPASMFRPPIDRTMRVLNRSFFHKIIPLAAARVLNSNQISKCRSYLGHDLLLIDRIASVQHDATADDARLGLKSLLLQPSIRPDEPSTWTSRVHELVEEEKVVIKPYTLEMTYSDWDYLDILTSVLPEDEHDELPTGYSIVGHVAHLSLRDRYLQYKTIIADVLLDKNPPIKTVINKIGLVGAESEFRTFKYEVLAGDPSVDVEIKLLGCTFRFNYSKVYWSTRLATEHERMVNIFKEGEAVCDVMAGVGPFAVPAGKKRVFAWANDLNPDCYTSLKKAISSNKVSFFVAAFNEDGRSFIRESARKLREENFEVLVPIKSETKSESAEPAAPHPPIPMRKITRPKTFNHYVMNLPSTATTFLDSFIGLYHGQEKLFTPHTQTKLPMIHVYCFNTKSHDNKREEIEICQDISHHLGHKISPGDEETLIWDCRDVAPSKRMFCASFRLPPEVAFRSVEGGES